MFNPVGNGGHNSGVRLGACASHLAEFPPDFCHGFWRIWHKPVVHGSTDWTGWFCCQTAGWNFARFSPDSSGVTQNLARISVPSVSELHDKRPPAPDTQIYQIIFRVGTHFDLAYCLKMFYVYGKHSYHRWQSTFSLNDIHFMLWKKIKILSCYLKT